MLIGSEMVDHGIQIFDMKKLLDIDPKKPVKFDPVKDVTAHFTDLPGPGRSHNIVVHEDKDLLLVVGSQPRNDECRSGPIYVDLSDISNPTKIGCNPNDGYSHDVCWLNLYYRCYFANPALGSMPCVQGSRQEVLG